MARRRSSYTRRLRDDYEVGWGRPRTNRVGGPDKVAIQTAGLGERKDC